MTPTAGSGGLLLGLLLLATVQQRVNAADVDFMEAAKAGTAAGSTVVEVDSGDTLVFEGEGPYVLHGRKLLVSARTIRLEGNFRIQQFDKQDVPPPRSDIGNIGPTGPAGRRQSGRTGEDGGTGLEGSIGPTGDRGKAAPTIVLDIDVVHGPGTLTVVNEGGEGGQGGKGGQGGTGGAGEDGADGSQGAGECKAGGADGGRGGLGGKGGPGGTGGPGGQGGTVTISPGVRSEISAGRIVIVVKGGEGGAPGAVGDEGQPGSGGAGGSGTFSCTGGSGRGHLGVGSKGEPGKQGNSGPSGSVVLMKG